MPRKIAALTAVLAMIALAWFNGRPEAVGLVRSPWDWVAHFLVFFGFASLLAIGLGRERFWLVVALAVGYALFDEVRQLWLPGRDASVGDFVFDVLGVVAGLMMASVVRKAMVERIEPRIGGG